MTPGREMKANFSRFACTTDTCHTWLVALVRPLVCNVELDIDVKL